MTDTQGGPCPTVPDGSRPPHGPDGACVRSHTVPLRGIEEGARQMDEAIGGVIVSHMRDARNDREARRAQQARGLFPPALRNQRITLAADDQRRDSQSDQVVLDVIGQHDAHELCALARPDLHAVSDEERDVAPWLPYPIKDQSCPLLPQGVVRWIDGRPHQDRPRDPFWVAHGEVGHDLAAEGVRHDGRARKAYRVHPADEDISVACNRWNVRWARAAPIAGQVRGVDVVVGREARRRRDHVPTGDERPVHEDDRADGRVGREARDTGIDAQPIDRGPVIVERSARQGNRI